MIKIDKDWKPARENNWLEKGCEYWKMDFYGPFVYFTFRKYTEGKAIEVIPYEAKMTSAEDSMNHLDLLVEATKELYKEIGEFNLTLSPKRAKISIAITSGETRELIENAIKRMKLF